MSDPPEEHVLRWVSARLSENGTFFDVGAHYGWMSMVAAHRVGPGGHVVSFEPSPALFDILQYHKRLNGLKQIQLVEAAVSNANGGTVALFLINEGLSFRNSLTIGEDDTPYLTSSQKTRIDVASITLDGFVLSSGMVPDVIKIDVEGAELLVLEGAQAVLSTYHPVLILGTHPFWLPRTQSIEQIFAVLNRHDYRIVEEHTVTFGDTYLADYLCVQSARDK